MRQGGVFGAGRQALLLRRGKGCLPLVNRRSYSRIFAALTDEATSEAFASKYRRSPYYKELYAQLVEEYGKGCCLPPEQEPESEAPWEKPPKDLPKPFTAQRGEEDA